MRNLRKVRTNNQSLRTLQTKAQNNLEHLLDKRSLRRSISQFVEFKMRGYERAKTVHLCIE